MSKLRFKAGDLVEPSPSMSLNGRELFGVEPKRIEYENVCSVWTDGE